MTGCVPSHGLARSLHRPPTSAGGSDIGCGALRASSSPRTLATKKPSGSGAAA